MWDFGTLEGSVKLSSVIHVVSARTELLLWGVLEGVLWASLTMSLQVGTEH